MAIRLGPSPDHGFDQPLGLLCDCHRRVEKFLGVLARVAIEGKGGSLDDTWRDALAAGLRYFATAAPRHTQDEEASLFPRMRRMADPQVRQALATVEALEAEHLAAAPLHDEVSLLGQRWLDGGELSDPDAARLIALLEDLQAIYRRHIAREESEVFPLAARHLAPADLAAMGQEMADRRGLVLHDSNSPAGASGHVKP